MYHAKDCVKKFLEHIEGKVKHLYAIFPQQPMTKLTDVVKTEHKLQKSVISVLKSLIILRIER